MKSEENLFLLRYSFLHCKIMFISESKYMFNILKHL